MNGYKGEHDIFEVKVSCKGVVNDLEQQLQS